MDDLSQLTAGEREVLALLAEGHTAKSVATMTGLSIAAVNERLRAARRKTGASSSRELARTLRLQENRDEEIELPASAGMSASGAMPDHGGAGRRLLMPAMMLIAALGAAGAALMMQQGVPPAPPTPAAPVQADAKPPADPLIGSLIDPRDTLASHYREVRSQKRDEPWATTTEALLRQRFARVPSMRSVEHDLRIICASTLCEVAGRWPKGLTPKQNERFIKALQQGALIDDLERNGLQSRAAGFSDNFVLYWKRGAPKVKRRT